MPALILPTAELALETRRKSQISNRLNREPPLDGVQLAVTQHINDYKTGQHRPVGPCNTYNCHGLTFGARRTWIDGSDSIQTILEHDDYVQITDLSKVMVGDVAIYRKEGIIEHSGVVVEKTLLLPPRLKILSKWANLHEVIHYVLDCPYSDMEVTYYRICE